MLKSIAVITLFLILASAAIADGWKPAPNSLTTPWTDKVDPANPLPEYPRPQMVRKEWVNLNGLWDYAIADKGAAKPGQFDGKILVPYPVESALSGVRKPLLPAQRLWYRRAFAAPALDAEKRMLIHFGAVDWEATVWINGKELGTHKGGYDEFTYDITDALKAGGENELVVGVWDSTGANGSPHGKQQLSAMTKPGGIMYTPTSGIWQTVWLEPVSNSRISGLKIIPDLDQKSVHVTSKVDGGNGSLTVTVTIKDGDKLVAMKSGTEGKEITIPIEDPKVWTPEEPHLYDVHVMLGKDADSVDSYFGMRKIALGKDEKGITRLMLNNKPVFMAGPLDQGFWPDGLHTAPTDEALRYDIEITKKLGFNTSRKHTKIEPDRWYYWCDKLGLLVWQDMPGSSTGKGANKDHDGTAISEEANKQFETELHAMIDQHVNHPSIVMWVVFNEGWGQYDTKRLTQWTKELDPTRLVSNTSGWNDEKCGDIIDMHNYPGPGSPAPEETRAAVLGEFGGLGLPVDGHKWVEASWGYRNMADTKRLSQKYIDLWKKVWELRTNPGLCGAIYTQLTDVETESNGLLTYDRKVIKVDLDKTAAAVARGEFPPALVYTPVVPTAEADAVEWRYTVDKPSSEAWIKPDFDAAAWKQGPAGFGSSASKPETVRTPWKTADIWLRREITLPEGKTDGLMLRIYHDDDAEVYLNGVPAAKLKGSIDAYEPFDIAPEALAALKPGKNVIAIHCHQVRGGQFIDAGLVREEQPKP